MTMVRTAGIPFFSSHIAECEHNFNFRKMCAVVLHTLASFHIHQISICGKEIFVPGANSDL